MRIYMRDRYYARRAQAIRGLGGKCARCPSLDRLEIDHIDPKQKSFNISRVLAGGSATKLAAELAKCQLLCTACHAKKTLLDKGQSPATHGSITMYKFHKCRCDECRRASNTYERERKKRNAVEASVGGVTQ
jgi:hypothetical protein